jgi:FSR family fosmidomycin resistance protein-like MFS transporter
LVLVGGTLLAAVCFLLAGISTGVVGLLAALLVGGIGASVQHPIASSMIASAYAGARSRAALGIYNFTGDIGKFALPAITALLLTVMPWRSALWILAGLGIIVALLLFVFAPQELEQPGTPSTPRESEYAVAEGGPRSAPAVPARGGFRLLLVISLIDSAGRMGFLTFLPFLLQAKGASIAEIGIALSLVFAGGALGKLVRLSRGDPGRAWHGGGYRGTHGRGHTGSAPDLPRWQLRAIAPYRHRSQRYIIGPLRDGAGAVTPEGRTRAFGIFYTGTAGAAALAPPVMGAFGDRFGVPNTMVAIAISVLATIPLAAALNPLLARHHQG